MTIEELRLNVYNEVYYSTDRYKFERDVFTAYMADQYYNFSEAYDLAYEYGHSNGCTEILGVLDALLPLLLLKSEYKKVKFE